MSVTRRTMARMLAAAAATNATVGIAAAQAPRQNPQPAAAKPTAGQDLESARQDLRTNALQISRVALPMATEPAFRFRA